MYSFELAIGSLSRLTSRAGSRACGIGKASIVSRERGFSLIEVLVALAVTSSLVVLLMGALYAFASTAGALSDTERRRNMEVAQALSLEPLAQRILFSREHASWGRTQIAFHRLNSRYNPAVRLRLDIEIEEGGRARLIMTGADGEARELWSDEGEEGWFEFLTGLGWVGEYPPANYYDAGLAPGTLPPAPASPLAIRLAVRRGSDISYLVFPVGGLPSEQQDRR